MSSEEYASGFKDGMLHQVKLLVQAMEGNTAKQIDFEPFLKSLQLQVEALSDIDPELILAAAYIAPTLLDEFLEEE